ncbi:TPA: type 1 fimbrial protein [Providencia rettgeri]|uniref:fimbrial protein n=1 Tax=Providencia sp. PROV032 TaxID=2949764 RepID=UPI00234A0F40|nr:fimbrial protein [Providencia sp. PROV032]HEC8323557.1 type 1 fimbrial protein [Providencia rettgeri]
MNKKIQYAIHCLVTTILLFPVKSFGYDAIFNVTGRVSSNTCSIQSSRIQNIHLGDYTISQSGFGLGSGVNSQSKDVRWQIDFDCDKGTKINIALQGRQYPGANTVLDIDNSTDKARGIGIRVEYSNDRTSWYRMIIGGRDTLASPSYVDGKLSIYFNSYYIQMEKTITPGKANATMDIEVTYG